MCVILVNNDLAYVGNPIDVIKKLYGDKKWQEIIQFCQKMLEEDQKDLTALQNLATALLNLGRFDDVISHCNTVLEINEFDEYALKNKIFALEKLGKYDQVLVCCDKLLSKTPSHTWALDTKGLALNQLGQHNEAINNYSKSLEIDPNNLTALLNTAITFSFLQKHDQAILFYDRAQMQEKTKEVALAKSQAYQKIGKEDEAFLAAQGLLIDEINRYVTQARAKKMKVFDYFCMMEYEYLEKREQEHQQKLDSKLK